MLKPYSFIFANSRKHTNIWLLFLSQNPVILSSPRRNELVQSNMCLSIWNILQKGLLKAASQLLKAATASVRT